MAVIKLPKNLKVFIYKKESYFVIKFLNIKGCVKKKLNSDGLSIKLENNQIIISSLTKTNSWKDKDLANKILIYKIIIEQIILNMFKFVKDRLILEGVGFKVWKKKGVLKFKLGYSVPLFIKIPSGIKVSIYKQRKLTISSLYTQYLRIFVQRLRLLRFPDAYKKKGVRFWGELIKLKVGKKTR